MGRASRLITVLGVGLLATGFASPARADQSSAGKPGLDRFYTQRLSWTGCGERFQCARLTVPLDYRDPGGETIQIAVIRLPAAGGKRIGSLVTNPGGPGGSGLEFLRESNASFGPALRAQFDLVSFDPRGVGESTPVRCLTGPEQDAYLAVDDTPETRAEEKALKAAEHKYLKACERNSGHLLPHVGTLDAARDMDVLRAALGDERLSYLGFSYGTYLGAVYADLFPKRVRTMTLDGAIDPALTDNESVDNQGAGFDLAYTSFVKDCFKAANCPFKGRTVAKAFAETRRLLKRADRKSLPSTTDDRKVTEPVALTGIMSALYSADTWPELRHALTKGFKGDGTGLQSLADFYNERRPDGTYSNIGDAFRAVNCADRPRSTSATAHSRPVAYVENNEKPTLFADYFGDGDDTTDSCANWPAEPSPVPNSLPAKGSAPILVVGTLRDSATPYAQAKALARQFDSGVLLTLDGDGHTAFFQSECVRRQVSTYLLTGKTPRNGTVCAAGT
ncbi:alpha/beta hydrolase [Acrocarpospora catenulata]|uniref:alpha/beta hydrolase n=1 Tax=Acrocarpospora catenulata TaxID=2836182 RepID=UPI001BD94369|nr:alpha/beta hydrolase [Acrocarpospora catenulata]